MMTFYLGFLLLLVCRVFILREIRTWKIADFYSVHVYILNLNVVCLYFDAYMRMRNVAENKLLQPKFLVWSRLFVDFRSTTTLHPIMICRRLCWYRQQRRKLWRWGRTNFFSPLSTQCTQTNYILNLVLCIRRVADMVIALRNKDQMMMTVSLYVIDFLIYRFRSQKRCHKFVKCCHKLRDFNVYDGIKTYF